MWFHKEENQIDKMSKVFIDEFPSWAIKHSAKLISELKESRNEYEKSWANLLKEQNALGDTLIDYFTAAHAIYINSLPDAYIQLLGGGKKIASALSLWPSRSQNFFLIASKFHQKVSSDVGRGGKSSLVESFEKVFSSGGNLEPLAVHISTAIAHSISQEMGVDTDDPFSAAGLYSTLFRLSQEQLEWVSSHIIKRDAR